MSSPILLVDDDTDLNRLVRRFLTSNGFEVVVETQGNLATDLIFQLNPLLVILDIMLPGMDGLSICRIARNSFNGPILILTALADDIDQVAGLETGADAYLAKPVKPRVLLAHIRALLRRSNKTSINHEANLTELKVVNDAETRLKTDSLVSERLKINTNTRTIYFDGDPLLLTSGEFNLLSFLVSHAGEIVSRDSLHLHVRGLEYDGIDRTVDQYISKIRKKLGDDAKEATIIKSVRGAGYLLTP